MNTHKIVIFIVFIICLFNNLFTPGEAFYNFIEKKMKNTEIYGSELSMKFNCTILFKIYIKGMELSIN